MSSSERRPRAGRRVALSLACALACAVASRAADAQGVVRGRLALVEREGADAADLRDAVVWLEARGAAPGRRGAAGDTIVMRGREFVPHVVAVPVGGTVAFPNDDPFSHNVFSNAEPGPFDLGLYRRGATHAATFPNAGVYPIYCNIHSKMVSFVVAVPTPWVTRADAAGRFALTDVPPGTYVLRAWHERAPGGVTRELTVPAGRVDDVRLTLDARAYVAAPHLNKFGRPYAMLRADRY